VTVNIYEKVSQLNNVFGVWRLSNRLRVTYVSPCYLVVWDHEQNPPKRYDCKGINHDETCHSVVNRIHELSQP